METVESVLSQSAYLKGNIELEYIVIDGASTDNTTEILMSVAGENSCINLCSEPDSGMYDALSKGLMRATGDIVGYINAGDYYHKAALEVVEQVFRNPQVKWITGLRVVYNTRSAVVSAEIPYKYRSRLFKCGAYDGIVLPHVQQESTFWRRALHAEIDFKTLASFKLSGDYYLWHSFSRKYSLLGVQAYLGGFRKHWGQLSENSSGYLEEIGRISKRATIFDRCAIWADRILWHSPDGVKRRLGKILTYSHKNDSWVPA